VHWRELVLTHHVRLFVAIRLAYPLVPVGFLVMIILTLGEDLLHIGTHLPRGWWRRQGLHLKSGKVILDNFLLLKDLPIRKNNFGHLLAANFSAHHFKRGCCYQRNALSKGSQTRRPRATCGPWGNFVRSAMLFGNCLSLFTAI